MNKIHENDEKRDNNISESGDPNKCVCSHSKDDEIALVVTTAAESQCTVMKSPQLNINGKSKFTLNPSRLKPPVLPPTTQVQIIQGNNTKEKIATPTSVVFVPLIAPIHSSSLPTTDTCTSSSIQSTLTTSTTFVFGQNLQDRVLNTATTTTNTSSYSDTPVISESNELLFSSVVGQKCEIINKNDKRTLLESAQEYEAARPTKRKYEAVQVITGEENEKNIMNFTCKLFAFDKTVSGSSWQERGQGTLRLNDFNAEEGGSDIQHSRLVVRTIGNLRVVLNTKLWSEMSVEPVGGKSLRFTALDTNGEARIFLIKANVDDCKQLHLQLTNRIQQLRALQHEKHNTDKNRKIT